MAKNPFFSASRKQTRKESPTEQYSTVEVIVGIGSDLRRWEIKRGNYVCGVVEQFVSDPTTLRVFGREYGLGPMDMLGHYRSLNACVICVKHIGDYAR